MVAPGVHVTTLEPVAELVNINGTLAVRALDPALEALRALPHLTPLYAHTWTELPTLPPELEDVMIEVLYPDFPGDPGPDVLMGSWAASRGWHSTPDGEPVLGKVLRWMPVPKGKGA